MIARAYRRASWRTLAATAALAGAGLAVVLVAAGSALFFQNWSVLG